MPQTADSLSLPAILAAMSMARKEGEEQLPPIAIKGVLEFRERKFTNVEVAIAPTKDTKSVSKDKMPLLKHQDSKKLQSETVPYSLFHSLVKERESLTEQIRVHNLQREESQKKADEQSEKMNLLLMEKIELENKLKTTNLELAESNITIEHYNYLMTEREKLLSQLEREQHRGEVLENENHYLSDQIEELTSKLNAHEALEQTWQCKYSQLKEIELKKDEESSSIISKKNEELQILSQSQQLLMKQLDEALRDIVTVKSKLDNPNKTPQIAPTGKVTIVFSDVANSTLIWEQRPQTMTQALQLHNQVIRNNVSKFGGYEVKTEGDSFMVAFSKIGRAIAFCVAVQEDLLDAEWPAELLKLQYAAEEKDKDGQILFKGLRVRMGAHVGIPLCQEDPVTGRMDYFGRMVNKAARITAVAAGGQILMSSTTWEQAKFDTHLRDRAVHENIGPHKLKDIASEVEIVQVLPGRVSSRIFAQKDITNQPMPKISNSLLAGQMEKLVNDNEILRRQVAEMEERLNHFHDQAKTFGMKLTELRLNSELHTSPNALQILYDEFTGMMARHEEITQLCEMIKAEGPKITTQVQDLNTKFQVYLAKEEEVKDNSLMIVQPKFKQMKDKMKNIKEQLTKNSFEKKELQKNYKKVLTKLDQQQQQMKSMSLQLTKKQSIIAGLEAKISHHEQQIEQLSSELSDFQHDANLAGKSELFQTNNRLENELAKARQQIEILSRIIMQGKEAKGAGTPLGEYVLKGKNPVLPKAL